MSSKSEKEKLAKIRNDLIIQDQETRKALDSIKPLFAAHGANGMHNVSIMFNNKLSEILHEYYKVGLELFDGGFLDGVVFNYILDAYSECINILDEILIYLKTNKIFYPSNNAHVIGLIRKYINISEGLYAFDLKNNLDKAIFSYSISHMKKGYLIDIDKAMDDMKPDLIKLGIDPEPLKEYFFIPKEKVVMLKIRPKKDIKK